MAHKNDPKGAIPIEEFYRAWVENGRNATEAYLSLSPDVTRQSAATIGNTYVGKLKASDVYKNMIGKALQVVEKALESDNEKIALDAAKDTLNRGYGKAQEKIDVTSGGKEIKGINYITPSDE